MSFIVGSLAMVSVVTSACDREASQQTEAVGARSAATRWVSSDPETPICVIGATSRPTISLTPERALAGARIRGWIVGAQPHELLAVSAHRAPGADHPVSSSTVRIEKKIRAGALGGAGFSVSSYQPGRYVLRIKGECGTHARARFLTPLIGTDGFSSVASGVDPSGEPWSIAISDTACAGAGLAFAYRGQVRTTCFDPPRAGPLRPVAYLTGTLIALASADVEAAKLHSFQGGQLPGSVLPLRIEQLGFPRIVVVFRSEGSDGELIGYGPTGRERVRVYAGLPPICVAPHDPNCLA
jgi:hypothetical protein